MEFHDLRVEETLEHRMSLREDFFTQMLCPKPRHLVLFCHEVQYDQEVHSGLYWVQIHQQVVVTGFFLSSGKLVLQCCQYSIDVSVRKLPAQLEDEESLDLDQVSAVLKGRDDRLYDLGRVLPQQLAKIVPYLQGDGKLVRLKALIETRHDCVPSIDFVKFRLSD